MPAQLKYTLTFLADLAENNTREWFNANRDRYEDARAAFVDVVQEIIARFDGVDDLGGLTPEGAVYRLNRDARFSPDKSPYKTNMGALLGKDGRKSTGTSYYFQVKPGGESLVASGMYWVFPAQLEAIRQHIAAKPYVLRGLIDAPKFRKFFPDGMVGEQLKTSPKNYPKDHPAIDLLRYKQFMADHPLSDDFLLSDGLVDHILEVCAAVKPFADYFQQRVEGIPVPERPR